MCIANETHFNNQNMTRGDALSWLIWDQMYVLNTWQDVVYTLSGGASLLPAAIGAHH